MAGNGKKNADEALILALASGTSVAAAAQHAGVSERTAHRRLQDPVFKARVSDARGELVRQTVGRLCAIGALATNTLHEILKDKDEPTTTRLAAARSVIDFMFRGHEYETLAKKMEELSREIEEVKRGGGGVPPGSAAPA